MLTAFCVHEEWQNCPQAVLRLPVHHDEPAKAEQAAQELAFRKAIISKKQAGKQNHEKAAHGIDNNRAGTGHVGQANVGKEVVQGNID